MIVKVKHSNALGLVLQWKFGTEKHCISHELQRPQPLQLLSTRLNKSHVTPSDIMMYQRVSFRVRVGHTIQWIHHNRVT